MSTNMRERSFYAGLAIVCLSLLLYGVRSALGHVLALNDLLFHAMPFTLGLALMAPKALPMVMGAVIQVFGKWRATP